MRPRVAPFAVESRRVDYGRRKEEEGETDLRTSWHPSHFFLSALLTFIPRLASAQAPTASDDVLAGDVGGLLARRAGRRETSEKREELA